MANQLDFEIVETGQLLHLFVSHWPSRLWCNENSADRHVLGIRLREAVDEINKIYGNKAYSVLLGDYNDEPFDSSLEKQLLAVRSRQLVKKNPMLLYNPFWRHLGELNPHIPKIKCRYHCGSTYWKTGRETRWKTFDQIIFSSSFIGDSFWQLNEEYTEILRLPPFDIIESDKRSMFDHLPVISVIENEEYHD